MRKWPVQVVCSACAIEWTSESMNVWSITCHIPRWLWCTLKWWWCDDAYLWHYDLMHTCFDMMMWWWYVSNDDVHSDMMIMQNTVVWWHTVRKCLNSDLDNWVWLKQQSDRCKQTLGDLAWSGMYNWCVNSGKWYI